MSDGFVLIGHSLGAALMAGVIKQFGLAGGESPIREAHLLGAAYPASSETKELMRGVHGTIYNYHSRNDKTLGILYRGASFGTKAAGHIGLIKAGAKIRNVDVTDSVANHGGYVDEVVLCS